MSRLSVQLFAFNAAIARELRERLARLALPTDHPDHLRPLSAPSEYQTKIFDWIRAGKGSAIVKAVAGSGKTTTILQGIRYIPDLVPTDVRASTFHAVGYSAILRHLGKKAEAVKPDGGKMKRLLRDNLGDVEYDLYGDYVARLVGLAKGQGVGTLVPDAEGVWYGMIQHHDLFLDAEDATEERAVELARLFLRRSNELARSGTIDFDDQLYLPLLWKLRLWQNDWVIVDEAQDTNPVRRALARLALRPGGRLLAVGDQRQAIYGFTGASHDALDLIQHEFSCTELPLTISYRCPRTVGERARELVSYFETAPGAAEGNVEEVPFEDGLKRLGPADAILCRNTAPLIGAAFTIIARGIGCKVLGKDIGSALVKLVKQMRSKGLEDLQSKLEVFCTRETAKHQARGEENKAEAVQDRVACITTVIDNLDERSRTVPALLLRLESMFVDGDSGVLTLSTQHKAKGREWRRVAILRPDLNPSKWARQDWQYLQEQNLMYVAWTRTTEELLFLIGDGRKA
jgi:superfamily I DNA/RNA helicase